MINTEDGKTKITGTAAEILADGWCVIKSIETMAKEHLDADFNIHDWIDFMKSMNDCDNAGGMTS